MRNANAYGNGRPAVPSCVDGGWGGNYPLGMSPLELMTYDKGMYDLYRTNGGMGAGMIDAFPYDPVVSMGFLASDYVLSEGLAWAYLLRPDAQDNINPADGMVVPVDTYTNNRAMPPYEKVMVNQSGKEYEVSYTGAQLDMQAQIVAANGGTLPKNINMFNHIGDNSSYWAQEESRIAGPMPDRSTVEVTVPPTGPPPRPNLSTNPPPSPGPAASSSASPAPATTTPPPSSAPTSGPVSSAPIEGAPAEVPSEGGRMAVSPTPKECKFNWLPVLIGLAIGLLAGYFYAKQKNKNKKISMAVGGLILGGLGYLYAHHQCKPITALSKIGVPSESGFCAACGGVM